MARYLKSRVFVIYVAANMLAAAVIFAPWILPRETISGLAGRWRASSGWRARVGGVMVPVIDRIHRGDPNHCAEVYRMEADARRMLYP